MVVRDYRVLVVDDERNIRNVLQIFFRRQGIYCDTASSMYEALKKVEEPFDVFILDLRLPDGDGVQILKEVKRRYQHSIAIMLTAYGTVETAVEAMKLGAFDFITKPFKVSAFEKLMDRVFKHLDLLEARETAELEADEGLEILGRSASIKELLSLVKEVSSADAPLLIEGETGTGKGFIAKAVHGWSSRKEAPFVKAVVSGLLNQEREIFGYEPGEGDGGQRGLIELADSGTFYLANIEELIPPVQAKLLTFMTEGSYRKPGSLRLIQPDVRLVLSTEVDLSRLVDGGKFNEDLYVRLKWLSFKVPSLRDRREDIPYLLNRFIALYSEKYEKRITGFSAGFLESMKNYTFSGNIREMQSLVERCVVLSGREVLDEDLLPPDLLRQTEKGTLDLLLERVERDMIIKALREAGGNKTRAAEILGISFRSLRYRLKKLGLG